MHSTLSLFLLPLCGLFVGAETTTDCSQLPRPIAPHSCCRFPELFPPSVLELCHKHTVQNKRGQAVADTDEIPGFFLKIAKNIPRVGRRSDAMFMKSLKHIPRIGRSVENESHSTKNFLNWLDDQSLQPIEKRRLDGDRVYSVVQPVNSNTLIELLEKDAIPSDNVKFVHWKDFDIALQLDADLYAKVMSLGRAPDQRLKDDLSIRFRNIAPWFDGTAGEGRPEFMPYQFNNNVDNYDFLHYNHL